MEFRTILSAKILLVFVENNDSRIVLAKTTRKIDQFWDAVTKKFIVVGAEWS